MRRISKKNCLRFEKLMTELFQKYGLNLKPGFISHDNQYLETKYGKLEIRGFTSGYLYDLFTRFDDPSKLPGEQVPYHFARPDTHQTFSRGGHIAGHGFNGYSGKWNFHLHDLTPDEAVTEIQIALEAAEAKVIKT